jgi:hypothetical protein
MPEGNLPSHVVAREARAALQRNGFSSYSTSLAKWQLDPLVRPVHVEHISNTGGSMLCDVIMSHRGCRSASKSSIGKGTESFERRRNCKADVEGHLTFMRAASLVDYSNHRSPATMYARPSRLLRIIPG